jgi:hypothetical protein
VGAQLGGQLGALVGLEAIAVGDGVAELGQQLVADGLVAGGLLGVVADGAPRAQKVRLR